MAKKKKIELEDPLEELKTMYENQIYGAKDLPSARKNPIKSGSLILDTCLGIGGYPKGRIIEVFGPESSAKTALGYHMLRNVDGPIAVIDAERSYDPEDPLMYGVNMDNLFVLKPESMEDAMEMACDLASKGIKAFMFDSIAGIATEAELSSDISEETKMGDKAKRMSKLMRQLPTLCEKNMCTAYFVNQIREKMNSQSKVTPGGFALQFAASIRIEIKYTESFPNSDNPEGMYLNISTKKNKLSSPNKKSKLPFLYGHGISSEMEILEMASQQNIVVKRGSWYSYGDISLGQGMSNTRQMLEDNPDLCTEILGKIDFNEINLEKLFKTKEG